MGEKGMPGAVTKPIGNLSVHKDVCSNPKLNSGLVSSLGVGDVPGLVGSSNIDIESGGRGDKVFGMERPVTWRDLKMDSFGEKGGILSGFKVVDSTGEVEKLNGIYSWLRKDLEELQRENRALRRSLEEIKACSALNYSFEEKKSVQKPVAAKMSYAGFTDTRSKTNVGDVNAHKDVKKPIDKGGSLEDELQKAIKAASGS